MIGVPEADPFETKDDFATTADSYNGGVIQETLTYPTDDGEEGEIEIGVGGSDSHNSINVVSWDFDLGKCLWTAVHWCRAHEVEDGTVAVIGKYDGLPRFQLDGLYRLAGFDLWESERV